MEDLTYLRNVLKAIKHNPHLKDDIIDSLSDNQFKSKNRLIELLNNNNILNKDLNVVILGCWYGSILVKYLAPVVNHITAIDMNDETIRIGKNELFHQYGNVDWITADIFNDKNRDLYKNANLYINTSCEHMKPMNQWHWFPSKAFFAFQSNNMYDIEGHINCVNNIEEFKYQMPKHLLIEEDEINDDRGTRFTLIGEICI